MTANQHMINAHGYDDTSVDLYPVRKRNNNVWSRIAGPKKQTRSSLKATQHLSEYELARLARMAENQEMLASLNIPSIPDVRPQKRKAKLTRKDADEDGAYKPSDDDAEECKSEPRRRRSKKHTTG